MTELITEDQAHEFINKLIDGQYYFKLEDRNIWVGLIIEDGQILQKLHSSIESTISWLRGHILINYKHTPGAITIDKSNYEILLDKFATNAMNGILACNTAINVENEHLHDALARAAYQMAVAMMRVRKEYLK